MTCCALTYRFEAPIPALKLPPTVAIVLNPALVQDETIGCTQTAEPGYTHEMDFRGPKSFDLERHEEHVLRNRDSLHYQPMVILLIAVSSGILIDFVADVPGYVWFWVASVSMILVQIWSWRIGDSTRKQAALALMLAFIALGGFWHHARWNWYGKTEIARIAKETATPMAIEGKIVSEPRRLAKPTQTAFDNVAPSDRTRFEFRVTAVRNGEEWEPATGCTDLVVHVDASDLRSGMHVRVFGKLVKIRPPTNPGQVDFSYIYRSRNKLAAIHVYHREAISVENSNSAGWLAKIRRHLNETIWRCVGEEHAGLASAILLGNRDQMTMDRREMYLVTGTVHLLAISGLHVGILAGLFYLLFRAGLLNRKQFLISTIIFTLLYCWLVEFRPPVTRASILISLLCVGRLCGQNSLTFHWLAIAGFLVLVLNPTNLFNLGPQLSFLAVSTIAFGRQWMFWQPSKDPLDRLIANTRPTTVRVTYWFGRQLRSAFLVSAIIWLVALPLVANKFHLLAPIALVLNPFLLIPIAVALYCGLAVLLFGSWLPGVGEFFGALCDWNLGVVEGWIRGAESWTAGHFWTPGPPILSVWLFYLLLLLVAVYPLTKLRGSVCLALAAIWFVFCWLIPVHWAARSTGDLQATFVDVGHGCGVILRTPSGETILYDAGCLGSARYAATNISNVLWHQQVARIDTLILSHADLDHLNAVPTLLKRFAIGNVLISTPMAGHDSPTIQQLMSLFAKYEVPVETVHGGQQLEAGEVQVQVLSPPALGTETNDNSDSLTLLLNYRNHRLLLCGDLERAGLEALLATKPIDCDVVLAPHHGSKNSQPEEFVDWSQPEHIVVSAASQKIDRAVIAAWKEKGIDVYATGDVGAVKVQFGAEIVVRSWRDVSW